MTENRENRDLRTFPYAKTCSSSPRSQPRRRWDQFFLLLCQFLRKYFPEKVEKSPKATFLRGYPPLMFSFKRSSDNHTYTNTNLELLRMHAEGAVAHEALGHSATPHEKICNLSLLLLKGGVPPLKCQIFEIFLIFRKSKSSKTHVWRDFGEFSS